MSECQSRSKLGLHIAGMLLMPLLWVSVKWFFAIPDRFLPGPVDVAQAAISLDPPIYIHMAATTLRLLLGFVVGVAFGLFLAALLHASQFFNLALRPSLIAIQNVPPLATVPFFILWFGFSETGKFLIVFLASAVNLAMYGLRTLEGMEIRYRTMIKSYQVQRQTVLMKIYIPYLVAGCLPTIRYMLSISVGLVLFSELLGAQLGLGYLIQTARSTFSMSLVFLAALLSSLIYVFVDYCTVVIWKRAFPWSL